MLLLLDVGDEQVDMPGGAAWLLSPEDHPGAWGLESPSSLLTHR